MYNIDFFTDKKLFFFYDKKFDGASGAPGENMEMQQTNHFVVDLFSCFHLASGYFLYFVGFHVVQITHYKI
jgi:hypothetical protein